MGSEEPEPERDPLVERVEQLEERMTPFAQDFRSLPVPSVETQDTDAPAPLLLESIPHRRRTMGRRQKARDPAAGVRINAAGGVSTALLTPPVMLMMA
jgi:hypothetical protein